ncbi:unnamed protein product, partial [Ceratitis capitata]
MVKSKCAAFSGGSKPISDYVAKIKNAFGANSDAHKQPHWRRNTEKEGGKKESESEILCKEANKDPLLARRMCCVRCDYCMLV